MLSDTTTTTTNATPDLAESLRSLGLWLVADELDDFIARSTKNRSSVRQVLEELCRLELQERARKSVERRLRRSRVGRFKSMADFDWEWPEKIDRSAIERILTLGFMERAENVVLVASQGLGKTMIAKNLVHAAAQRGANAVFTTAADLLLDLSKQETARGSSGGCAITANRRSSPSTRWGISPTTTTLPISSSRSCREGMNANRSS